MASSLHISIAAESVFHLFGIPISNSMLTSWVISILTVLLCVKVGQSLLLKGKLTRLQMFFEFMLEGLYNIVESIAGSTKAKLFFPLVVTFFIFIVPANWSGLLPGAGSIGFNAIHSGKSVFIPLLRGPTADINTALALSLITMIMVQVYGFKYLGFGYLKKFFNFSNPINAFVGILELVSEFSKIISFTFRLFGNIFAGEVLISVMTFLIPLGLPMPFYGLEIFVGVIQGLVFMMLSTVFMNNATLAHEGEH
ncbi:MAG: ATP synthase subunit a [Microgenomates group bacterium GW2011_GWA2_46_7]|nr:MAG: ATP synthase subunit a [Microgenomates group bacterium GW2011_GWA2_46_7]